MMNNTNLIILRTNNFIKHFKKNQFNDENALKAIDEYVKDLAELSTGNVDTRRYSLRSNRGDWKSNLGRLYPN